MLKSIKVLDEFFNCCDGIEDAHILSAWSHVKRFIEEPQKTVITGLPSLEECFKHFDYSKENHSDFNRGLGYGISKTLDFITQKNDINTEMKSDVYGSNPCIEINIGTETSMPR